jgi:O-antigen/teichoic acid export membrane protein
MITVSGRIGLMSDNLVAGGFLGPATVTSLYLTVRLPGLAQAQLQSIGGASWAGLAELHARDDRETFRRRLVELTTLVAVLGIAGLAPIAAYGRHFFDLWMRSARGEPVAYGGDAAVLIASANALLLGLFSLWGWCFAGTGQVRRMVAPSIVATAVNLAASLLLTWRLGLVGPVLGTLVANLTISLWWLPLLVRRDFGVSLRSLFGAVARPLAWGLPFGAALGWAAVSHRPWGWPGLAAEMGGAALGFLAFSYAVILSPTDRALWRLRLEGLLRPRKAGAPPVPRADDVAPPVVTVMARPGDPELP